MKKGLVACVAALAGLLALAAGPASARNAYVTNSGSGTVTVIDTVANSAVATVPVGGEPVDVAITPDGTRAYVVNSADGTVSVIDTKSNTVVGGPIPVGPKPRGIAITPDGGSAYVTNSGDDTVSLINTGANVTVGAPIPVGDEPEGIAISADGRRAFVAQLGGNVAAIDTGSNTVVGLLPNALAPARIAVGPRGGRAFVTNSGSNSITAFNPDNLAPAGGPISVGSQPAGIAIEPNGDFAFAASPFDSSVTPVNTALGVPIGASLGFPGATGVAIKPDGLQGYVTNGAGSSVTVLETSGNGAVGAIAVGGAPSGVAVVPNQGPVASFWVSPVRSRARKKLTLHASGSTDRDGRIVNFAWDFGDRVKTEGTSPTRVHSYRRPGTYNVTLVVTDNEGCSTEAVFTGQTMSCNGTAKAAITIPITVLPIKGPTLRLAGPATQLLTGKIKVRARCPRDACSLRGQGVGVAKPPGSAQRLRRLGRTRSLNLTRAWRTLRLSIPGRTRSALRRALLRGGKASAKVTVVAQDENGDLTAANRKIKLVLPGR